jgi:copper chaperone CopZ
MTCDHCATAVTRELGALDGVEAVRVLELVNGGTSTVRVRSAMPLSEAVLREAVEEAGYDIVGLAQDDVTPGGGCGCGGHGHGHDHGHEHGAGHGAGGCACGGHGHAQQEAAAVIELAAGAETGGCACGCGGHGRQGMGIGLPIVPLG